ncbi:MAG: hypothetical protein OSB19_03800 [Opitutaceae bacterium]|nr:hypothetical protein [Opitutaceae bacterium]
MPELVQQASELLDEFHPYTIVGIFAVFVLIIIGLGRLVNKPPSRLTAFSSETGSVLVSRKALQELIRQACLRDDFVEAARPAVKINGSRINTSVDLRLTSPTNLKKTTERLQMRISELLQKSLNFDQIGNIEIMVTSFGKSDVDDIPIADPASSTLQSKDPTPPSVKE